MHELLYEPLYCLVKQNMIQFVKLTRGGINIEKLYFIVGYNLYTTHKFLDVILGGTTQRHRDDILTPDLWHMTSLCSADSYKFIGEQQIFNEFQYKAGFLRRKLYPIYLGWCQTYF